jgi:protein SCO1/2
VTNRKKFFGILLICFSWGWLFAIPFIPLKSDKEINFYFPVKKQVQYILVFFGYPGCFTVCPLSLKTLSKVYTNYQKTYQDDALTVIFINLLPNVTAQATMRYAKHFNPDFLGYHLSKQQLNQAMEELGVSVFQYDGQEPQHSSYVYLLERQPVGWKIKYVYNQPNFLESNVMNDLRELKTGY